MVDVFLYPGLASPNDVQLLDVTVLNAFASAVGSASASAGLRGDGALASAPAGVAQGSATLVGDGALSVSIAGAASADGNVLLGAGAVVGTLPGVAASSSTLLGAGVLAGAPAGVAQGSATLAGSGAALVSIAGVASAAGNVLLGAGALSSTCSGVAAATSTANDIGHIQTVCVPSQANGASGSITINNVLAGHSLILGISTSGATSAVTSITDSAGDSWTGKQVVSRVFILNGGGIEVWAIDNASAGTHTLTINFNASVNIFVVVDEVKGLHIAKSFLQSSVATGNVSSTPDSGPIVTAIYPLYLFGFTSHASSVGANGAGTGWTKGGSATTGFQADSEWQLATFLSTFNATFTGADNPWTAIIAAFQGPGTSPIVGTIAASSTVAASLAAMGNLLGSIAGVAQGTYALAATGTLSCSPAGVSSTSALALGAGDLAAASSGTAAQTATLIANGLLSSTDAGLGSCAGTLLDGTRSSATLSAGATFAATLSADGLLALVSAGASSAAGTGEGTGELTGGVAAFGSATAIAEGSAELDSLLVGQGALSGAGTGNGTFMMDAVLFGSSTLQIVLPNPARVRVSALLPANRIGFDAVEVATRLALVQLEVADEITVKTGIYQ